MMKQQHFQYLVIGAGPAGIQMGYYLENSGLDYLILEGGESPGSFFGKFPRHRKLISINKIHTGYSNPEINLRHDWNSLLSNDYGKLIKSYSKEYFPSADDFLPYLKDFVRHYQIKIKSNTKINKIGKANGVFCLQDCQGNIYCCQYLIIATGVAKPYVPNIPGIESTENYVDVSVNAEDFTNQRVLILGKGNSGFETADELISTATSIHLASPSSIRMAWQTHFVGDLRALNNNILDTYQLKSQNAILDGEILQITKREDEGYEVLFKYAHAQGEIEELIYDRVICCTGFRMDDSIFAESCKPQMAISNKFPALTSEWESINVQNMYFIGTLMQVRDYKKQMSGFIHGFRYNIRALSRILAYKYHQDDLPSLTIEVTPETITRAIINRVNVTSALWQQPGFLCDVIVITGGGAKGKYYEDLPVDYVREKMMLSGNDYFLITLEYGEKKAVDPFKVQRIERTNKDRAEFSNFLHPIVRHYREGELVSTHHVIEDLAAEWLEEEHIGPLLEYCQMQINPVVPLAMV